MIWTVLGYLHGQFPAGHLDIFGWICAISIIGFTSWVATSDNIK